MIELKFLKELILIKQVHQKNVIIVTIGFFFLNEGFKFQADVCKGCHDVLMMFVTLNNVAISKVSVVYYRCIINGIRKMGLQIY